MSNLVKFKEEKKELESQISALVSEFVQKHNIEAIEVSSVTHYGQLTGPIDVSVRLEIKL